MRVDELIRLLQKFPGDYTVGSYTIANLHRARFRAFDTTVGVSNDKRRLAFSYGDSLPVTIEEIKNTFEVTP